MSNFKYFVNHEGDVIETGLAFIERYKGILIECTTSKEYENNEIHYCLGLYEDFLNEVYETFENEIKAIKKRKEKDFR